MDGSLSQGADGLAAVVRGLRVSFGGREVLRGVDADFEAGRLTMLVGRSGSGKTTLLRALNGLNACFEGCRSEGAVRVRLDGRLVDPLSGNPPPSEVRRRVGMVFQHPNVLPLSIEANLTVPLRHVLGLSRSAAGSGAEEALRRVGLWAEVANRLSAPAASLSGGQRQRLCLARALALGPDMLLLDEPAASLDVKSTEVVEALMESLRGRQTLVVVSHGLAAATRLADRLVVMRDGLVSATLDRAELAAPGAMVRVMEECF